MQPPASRTAWHHLEVVNAVTYFAEECRSSNKELGLRGFWMGYFASRAAPMGAVSAGVVAAAFYNFQPAMVRRAIPDAWSYASPAAIVPARSGAAASAIARLAPESRTLSAALLPLLEVVIDHARDAGRPLFSANRDVARPDDPLAALWQAATTLREHRGDGHVAVLTESDVDGCEAHILFAATEGVPGELLRENRGWSPNEWAAATERLRGRGLIERAEVRATPNGHDLRRDIEQRTDELAAQPYEALAANEIDRLLALASAIADPILASDAIPFPNPMGLPRPGP